MGKRMATRSSVITAFASSFKMLNRWKGVKFIGRTLRWPIFRVPHIAVGKALLFVGVTIASSTFSSEDLWACLQRLNLVSCVMIAFYASISKNWSCLKSNTKADEWKEGKIQSWPLLKTWWKPAATCTLSSYLVGWTRCKSSLTIMATICTQFIPTKWNTCRSFLKLSSCYKGSSIRLTLFHHRWQIQKWFNSVACKSWHLQTTCTWYMAVRLRTRWPSSLSAQTTS